MVQTVSMFRAPASIRFCRWHVDTVLSLLNYQGVSNLMPLRIGLVYDVFDAYPWRPGDPPDADAEYEPEETVVVLEAAVRALGHEPVRIGTAQALLQQLPSLGIDVAINIAESLGSRNREAHAPVLLELAGIPCLGSDALTLSVSLDKAWTKDLAAAVGVPTPPYRSYSTPDAVDGDDLPGPWPLFVKPRYEGTSKGITTDSRVESMAALRAQVVWIVETYCQDALVEPFVSGAEYTVAVIGNDPAEAMPVLQRAVEPTTRIGLHALEHRGLPERAWSYVLDGELTPPLEAVLKAHALAVYHKLECKDFARADFRVDEHGQPWFLEINPLPTFAPGDTFEIVAEVLGHNYPDFLARVLACALQRALKR